MEAHGNLSTFGWLTPGGSAALDLLWVSEALLHSAFRAKLDGLGPRLVRLRDAEGAVVEHAVACKLDHGIVVTCHGGPATRAELTRLLRGAGGCQEGGANLWGRRHPLANAAITDIPLVQGELGVSLLLRLAHSAPTPLLAALALPDDELGRVVAAWREAAFLYAPPRVQLWGPVNAGKSSLLNALCGETLAAVGPEAGLTRDVIDGRFEHDGVVVRVMDAPGEPEGGSDLDAAAWALAKTWRAEADVTLELVPPGREPGGEPGASVVYSRADEDPARREPGACAHDAESVDALKARIVRRFVGRLLALPEHLRVAPPRALLDELAREPDARDVLNRRAVP